MMDKKNISRLCLNSLFMSDQLYVLMCKISAKNRLIEENLNNLEYLTPVCYFLFTESGLRLLGFAEVMNENKMELNSGYMSGFLVAHLAAFGG